MSLEIHSISGDGPPTLPPPSLNAHYLDKTNSHVYFAVGTTTAGDWQKQEGDTDELVAVTASDASPGYLLDKVHAGNGIVLAEDTVNGQKKLRIGSNIIPGDGEKNTASNIGTGQGLFSNKAGIDLRFKRIQGTGSTTVTSTSDTVTVDSVGENNAGENVGSGADVYKQKSGNNLQMRSITAGSNVNVSQSSNEIEVSAKDEKVAVSATDSIKKYLEDALVAGTNITLQKIGSGADEKLVIASTAISTAVNYGAYYHSCRSNSISETTSTSYRYKVNLPTASLVNAKYKISWSYQWHHRSTSGDFEARLVLNNQSVLWTHREEPKDSGSDQGRNESGWIELNLQGVQDFELQYRGTRNSTTRIWNARLSIVLVGPTEMNNDDSNTVDAPY